MRDKKRIKKVLIKINQLWEKNQDLRFFQLIEFMKSKVDTVEDTFFLEDDKLLMNFDKWYNKETPENWSKKWKLFIMDIDGWRTDNKDFNEPITEQEFFNRAIDSTCSGDLLSAFKNFKKGLKNVSI